MHFKIKSVYLACFLLVAFSAAGYGQSNTAGRYKDEYGWLDLECNGYYVSNHFISTDTIITYGRWSRVRNNLTFYIDSSRSTLKGEGIKEFTIRIEDGVLLWPKITRKEYRVLKSFDKHGCLRQKTKPYSEYKLNRQRSIMISSYNCIAG